MLNGMTEYRPRAAQTEGSLCLATVAEKYTDGLSLIFDGQAEATAKHYKCNTGLTFAKGNRVVCLRCSGSWVVAFAFGNPK